jgi:lipoic acid synthetase
MTRVPSPAELPILHEPSRTADARRRLPRWLKRQVPQGNADHFTDRLLGKLQLETVCENARCPNRMECYSQKTASFMVLGSICTRSCSFCAVSRGKPETPDKDEPRRLAEAVRQLALEHVVITSVTRDDLPDGGADHIRQCVQAIRKRTSATIEVLTPDFVDCPSAVDRILEAMPDVFNHNTETVPRLYRIARGPKSDYSWTLELLRRVKQARPSIRTKSGLMLGLGETREELMDTLADLLDAGCDYLTLGQYLQPARDRYLPVVRYLPPEEFTALGRAARIMGFAKVASGPFVRSSYHARAMVESH